jgi:hypothetical protein
LDIATAIRSQMLATLMAAIDGAKPLASGTLSQGAVVSGTISGLTDEGRAVLQVGGQAVAVQFGGQARAANGQAIALGATVSLRIDAVDPGGLVKATVVDAKADPARSATAAKADPVQTPVEAATRAALARVVGDASAGQQELGPLIANLQAVATGTGRGLVPAPVVDAALRLLGLQYDPLRAGAAGADPAAGLRDAVATSGIAHEARLATGQPADAAVAAMDLKTALFILHSALSDMRGPGGSPGLNPTLPDPADAAGQQERTAAPPPHRDAMPRGQSPAEPDLASLGRSSPEIANALLRQADGALDRIRLLQAASLPVDAGGRADGGQGQRWLMELPINLDGRAAMLPLRIEREPDPWVREERRNARRNSRDGAFWRVRFALDGEPLGALHAIITWRMRQIGISLWAQRETTRAVLNASAPELRRALDGNLFDEVEIDIHAGRPVEPKPARGVLVDTLT